MGAYDRPIGLQVEIDCDLCMESGNCASAAPTAFDLDDNSVAFVMDPTGSPEDRVIAAARN